VSQGGRRQAQAMFYRLSWARGVIVRLLIRRNDLAVLWAVAEMVMVNMPWRMNDLMMTLVTELRGWNDAGTLGGD
jgi:hypothetical protein